MTTAVSGTRRAATPSQRVLRQARFEAITLLRNGEQLLVAIILPTLALLGLTQATVPDLGTPRVALIVPGVLALAIVSTAFTGQAISTAFDRRNGVLRLLGTTPLGRGGLLGGKTVAVAGVLAIHLLILSAIGLALGWRPALSGVAPSLVTVALGAACFVGLAMTVAGRLRAEAVLAIANILWVFFLGLGLLLPTASLPGALEAGSRWLPSGALGDAMRAALADGAWPVREWLVLLAWTAIGGLVAQRIFRWSD